MGSITICASFRFYDDVLVLQRRLEEAGVRTEIPVPNQYLDQKHPERLRERLVNPAPEVFEAFWRNMEMHQRRIIDTGLVYVFAGKQGYVGNGVSSEMGFSHCLRTYSPGEQCRTVLASDQLKDLQMRGFVQEIVPPEDLVSRLSSLHQ